MRWDGRDEMRSDERMGWDKVMGIINGNEKA